jgi:hypothetical protein
LYSTERGRTAEAIALLEAADAEQTPEAAERAWPRTWLWGRVWLVWATLGLRRSATWRRQ